MNKPIIKKENIKTMVDNKYVKVFDLNYNEGRAYFDATRRPLDDLVAIKSDEEYKKMLPDAVSCVVVLDIKGVGERLLLSYEYRYPAGRFLLGVPAGLMDPEDKTAENPLFETAKREIKEETGIIVRDTDRMEVINPLLFSSPGLTDESNAIVGIRIELEDTNALSQAGAEATECFNGFKLLTKAEAKELLKRGRDEFDNFYSVYTWIALVHFVSDIWNE